MQIIEQLINSNLCNDKIFEKLIGKLVRVSIIIPGSIIFITSFWHTLYSSKNGLSHLDTNCKFFLRLQIQIIYKSIIGTPIEKLLICLPTLIKFTDTSREAIGTYHFDTSYFQNYKFPFNILKFITINYLEFLTILIDLLLVVIENTISLQHILIWIDNISTVCQLKKIPKLDFFII